MAQNNGATSIMVVDDLDQRVIYNGGRPGTGASSGLPHTGAIRRRCYRLKSMDPEFD